MPFDKALVSLPNGSGGVRVKSRESNDPVTLLQNDCEVLTTPSFDKALVSLPNGSGLTSVVGCPEKSLVYCGGSMTITGWVSTPVGLWWNASRC